MKKSVLINIALPITYVVLYLLLVWQKLGHETRYFIAENSSALIVIQLIISGVNFFVFKSWRVKVAIVVLYLVFVIFWYATAGNFNPL